MHDLLETIDTSRVRGGIVLWWLGGASWVLKTRLATIYVDLFTGPAPAKTLTNLTKDIPDLIVPERVKTADFVLSTHEHIDHCHQESLVPIYRNTTAVFVGPPSSVRHFKEWGFQSKRIIELTPQQQFTHLGVVVTALPCLDCADEDAVAYIIQADGVTLFESADSLYFTGFRDIGQKWQIDIALINFFRNPPGANLVQSMIPEEVAKAATELNTDYLILKHWDIWKETKEDPSKVVEVLEGTPVRTLLLRQGEKYSYKK